MSQLTIENGSKFYCVPKSRLKYHTSVTYFLTWSVRKAESSASNREKDLATVTWFHGICRVTTAVLECKPESPIYTVHKVKVFPQGCTWHSGLKY